MYKLYLHIGYTNTISTLLKRKLFAKHPDINYLGIENQKWKKNLNLFKSSDSNEILTYIATYILHASRVEFENNLDNLKYLLSKLKLSKNKTNIISLTAFLNPSVQNYYWLEELKEKDLKNWLEKQKKNDLKNVTDLQISKKDYNFNVTSETFDRIKIIFNEFQKKSKLEVFYFIRNQADLFKSFYNHYNFNMYKVINKEYKFKEIIRNIKTKNEKNSIHKIMKYFNFHQVHNELVSIFNKDKVNCFIYEDFNNNNIIFFKKFSYYLNINQKKTIELLSNQKENMVFRYKDKSFHKDSQLLTNLRNSLFYKIFNKILSKKIKLLIKRYLASEIINYNTEQKNIIINYYLKSNILFSKQNKIDLKKLGYY